METEVHKKIFVFFPAMFYKIIVFSLTNTFTYFQDIFEASLEAFDCD